MCLHYDSADSEIETGLIGGWVKITEGLPLFPRCKMSASEDHWWTPKWKEFAQVHGQWCKLRIIGKDALLGHKVNKVQRWGVSCLVCFSCLFLSPPMWWPSNASISLSFTIGGWYCFIFSNNRKKSLKQKTFETLSLPVLKFSLLVQCSELFHPSVDPEKRPNFLASFPVFLLI